MRRHRTGDELIGQKKDLVARVSASAAKRKGSCSAFREGLRAFAKTRSGSIGAGGLAP